ncbi:MULTISPECIES: hypothetical protein [Parabacteroides]|uniref:Transmembrane protein n=1 Tax=Parabacteroides faecis TaxID=1217282 RepID=A0ABR6KIU0_9BACT|nr:MULTISPECIES: hypothetical protein [Parabacteroides]MBB4620817.1 hypothetical protein [Parabacteroides faecis]RHR36432.1 hypothetical protein DWX23_20950 [Parabacteroides sp. AF18-52]GGJ91705.1 hypothetical protein GCM10007084_14240 [Parabacteroides faecis]
MEERTLNEKESLALITQMISSSKKNMEIGQGNYMLIWGYFTTTLSIILFALVNLTHNFIWSWGWMLMFVMWPIMSYRQRQKPPRVVTYTDKVISQVWQVMGWMFIVTFLTIGIIEFSFARYIDFILMLPLSLIYCGIGVSITGIIIQERWMTYTPLIAFIIAIYMLTMLMIGEKATTLWYLYFGLSFVFMMIIPGHIVNHKAKKQCLKN